MNKIVRIYIICMLLCVTSSCFTGVESTQKISDKDVAKSIDRNNINESIDKIDISKDSFTEWYKGKQFYVSDNNAKYIFKSKNTIIDKDLQGDTITYIGYSEGSILDNEPKIIINFSNGNETYTYFTDKTIDEIKSLGKSFDIPFLIDLDVVKAYKEKLLNKDYYIRTSIWYNDSLLMTKGQKFISVKITDIKPGNKVYPLLIKFCTQKNKNACVLISTEYSAVKNKLFENVFSSNNIRNNYPSISDHNWNLITEGKVAEDMTKDECRLSLGSPNNIDERPTNSGLQEFWSYGDGTYLVFLDGLLKRYRR